jgi:hypothetical protein
VVEVTLAHVWPQCFKVSISVWLNSRFRVSVTLCHFSTQFFKGPLLFLRLLFFMMVSATFFLRPGEDRIKLHQDIALVTMVLILTTVAAGEWRRQRQSNLFCVNRLSSLHDSHDECGHLLTVN